jgi:hypothetical protein
MKKWVVEACIAGVHYKLVSSSCSQTLKGFSNMAHLLTGTTCDNITSKPSMSCHVKHTCKNNHGPQSVIPLLCVLNKLNKWALGEIVEDLDAET